MNATVSIAPACYEALTLEVWNELSDGERLQLADHLTDRLGEHGWRIDEVPALPRFGPASDEQTVLQWREAKTGVTFSLIPGGTFRPGYSTSLLTLFEQVFRALQDGEWRWEQEEQEEEEIEEEDGHSMEEELAGHTFDAYPGCEGVHLGAKPETQVGPFLITTELLTPSVPGLSKLARSRSTRLFDIYAESRPETRHLTPLDVTWKQATKIIETFGWDLPTSEEFEWALRAGRDLLFPWGNRVPAWLAEYQIAQDLLPADLVTDTVSHDDVMRVAPSPELPCRWPLCNYFGLAAPLALCTWCEVDARGKGAAVTRGGASSCFPWQYCREWMHLLTAMESRLPGKPRRDHHAFLRPVVRLESDRRVRFTV